MPTLSTRCYEPLCSRSQSIISSEPAPMLVAIMEAFDAARADVFREVDGREMKLELSYRLQPSSAMADEHAQREELALAAMWLARQTGVREAQWLLRVLAEHLESIRE